MARIRFTPGCPCCNAIGFDGTQYRNVSSVDGDPDQRYAFLKAMPDLEVVERIVDDPGKLHAVRILFVFTFYNSIHPDGTEYFDADGILFPEEDWPAIKEWVEAGGRLCLVGEAATTAMSELEIDTANAFLGALGVTLRFGAIADDHGEEFTTVFNEGQPVLDGLDPDAFFWDLTNEITGGTWILKTDPVGDPTTFNRPFLAIERLGNGHVIACGDSNVFHPGDGPQPPVNGGFIRRLIEQRDLIAP